MKIFKYLLISLIFFSACSKDDDGSSETVYKQRMRDFVISISQYAKADNPNFIIIPQNGLELVSDNGDNTGSPQMDYIKAIDGNGQEDLFYGYDNDDQITKKSDSDYLQYFLNLSKSAGKTILVTDYCFTPAKMTDSYKKNNAAGYISFAADKRELNQIPSYPQPIYNENTQVITSLTQVKNFLYLINPSDFSSKTDFINAVTASNYDLLIMDLFFTDGDTFTAQEVEQLRQKANGGKRLIISYMSIGEAEDYRYYWQTSWNATKPNWMDAENPHWEGNFKVKYWAPEWQSIIFGNENSYLKKILNAGFDGVYLDIIDAFEYYE